MKIAWVSKHVLAAMVLASAGVMAHAPLARAGGVLKIDQQAVNGEIVAFDGKDIVVQTGVAEGGPVRQSIPLIDVIRVRLAGGSAVTAPPRGVAPGTDQRVSPPAGGFGTGPNAGRGTVALPAPAVVIGGGTARGLAPLIPAPAPPGPITLPVRWQLRSVTGDLLEGAIRSWTQQQLGLEFQQGMTVVELPTSRVAEIWRTAPDLIRKAKELKAESDSEDVAYVVRDREIIAVKGVALGIEGESLKFRYDGEERKIGLARLLGVVLVPQKADLAGSGLNAFHQVAMLTNGRLVGRWQKLDSGAVVFQTLMGPTMRLPEGGVISIENRNGRVVYLSDMKPAKVEQTPYFDRIMPYREDISLSGLPLRLGTAEFEHGLAVHSRCVQEYDIGGAFEEFHTAIGFEQPQGFSGRATVRVLMDGQKTFENLDLRGDQSPVEVAANVRGVKQLTLEVDFGLNEDVGDRVIWGNPRLTRAEVGK